MFRWNGLRVSSHGGKQAPFIKRTSSLAVERQVADLCYQLSSGLKCGQSLFQALEDAARNLEAPLGATISAAVDSFKAGVPLTSALTEACRSLGSQELRQVARVLALVETLGSDPSIALGRTATAAESRLELRALLDAKMAEVRLSAYIVSGLPLLLSATSFALQPGLVLAALAAPVGRVAYMVGASLWVAGTYAVWRLSHPVWA